MASSGGPPQQPPQIETRKILGLVVHGIGDQKPGSTLRSFMNDFFPLIRACIYGETSGPPATAGAVAAAAASAPGLDVNPLDDGEKPEVTITFANPATPQVRYQLIVREVHWAQAFAPPSLGGLLSGMKTLLGSWLQHVEGYQQSAVVGIVQSIPGTFPLGLLRNLLFLAWFVGLIVFRALRSALAAALMLVLAVVMLPLATLLLVLGQLGWWRDPPRLLRSAVGWYAQFQPAIVELAIVLASPAIVALYAALLVLESIGPIAAILPEWVTKARNWLADLLTVHLGDVWIYGCQPWEASQIRTRFEKRFKTLVDEKGKGAHAMFVLAHSLGCPVSYEGLSGRRMSDFINGHFLPPGAAPDAKRIPNLYYFTVGSALPAMQRVIPKEEQGRLYRELPEQVRWEDFHSKYDPVQLDMILRYVVVPEEYEPPDDATYVVNNQMDMLSEHTAYWNNAEQVLAPILNRVTGGAFEEELRLNEDARIYRVSVLSACKALAWLMAPALCALMLWQGIETPGLSLILKLFEGDWEKYVVKPLGMAILNSIVVVLVYSTVIKWLWDSWDKKVKYRPLGW